MTDWRDPNADPWDRWSIAPPCPTNELGELDARDLWLLANALAAALRREREESASWRRNLERMTEERNALRERLRARPGSEPPPIDEAESTDAVTISVEVLALDADGALAVCWRKERYGVVTWRSSNRGRSVVRWWPLPGEPVEG